MHLSVIDDLAILVLDVFPQNLRY